MVDEIRVVCSRCGSADLRYDPGGFLVCRQCGEHASLKGGHSSKPYGLAQQRTVEFEAKVSYEGDDKDEKVAELEADVGARIVHWLIERVRWGPQLLGPVQVSWQVSEVEESLAERWDKVPRMAWPDMPDWKGMEMTITLSYTEKVG